MEVAAFGVRLSVPLNEERHGTRFYCAPAARERVCVYVSVCVVAVVVKANDGCLSSMNSPKRIQ